MYLTPSIAGAVKTTEEATQSASSGAAKEKTRR